MSNEAEIIKEVFADFWIPVEVTQFVPGYYEVYTRATDCDHRQGCSIVVLSDKEQNEGWEEFVRRRASLALDLMRSEVEKYHPWDVWPVRPSAKAE